VFLAYWMALVTSLSQALAPWSRVSQMNRWAFTIAAGPTYFLFT
jgi:hypothetical protein